jgi:hypothetical protein
MNFSLTDIILILVPQEIQLILDNLWNLVMLNMYPTMSRCGKKIFDDGVEIFFKKQFWKNYIKSLAI